MWSYYGSKSKIINYYPPPKYGKIIEPFAGSAHYSLRFFDRDVLINDKYEVVFSIWKWLQKCSKDDILKLPVLKAGTVIKESDFDCKEQFLLMGFLIANGLSSPVTKVSKWGACWFEGKKKKIANSLYKIRHWNITNVDFLSIENQEATWFIDPPYQNGGHKYKHSNKKIDFELLSNWCKGRGGQTIVCENSTADWMEFKPLINTRGNFKTTTECFYSNEKTNFDNEQIKMF